MDYFGCLCKLIITHYIMFGILSCIVVNTRVNFHIRYNIEQSGNLIKRKGNNFLLESHVISFPYIFQSGKTGSSVSGKAPNRLPNGAKLLLRRCNRLQTNGQRLLTGVRTRK